MIEPLNNNEVTTVISQARHVIILPQFPNHP